MKFTFIETPGHGYLKVPKNFFLASGADPQKISSFSGQSKTLLYLEEDCDATYFIKFMKEQNDVEPELEFVYRESKNFPTHNYSPNF